MCYIELGKCPASELDVLIAMPTASAQLEGLKFLQFISTPFRPNLRRPNRCSTGCKCRVSNCKQGANGQTVNWPQSSLYNFAAFDCPGQTKFYRQMKSLWPIKTLARWQPEMGTAKSTKQAQIVLAIVCRNVKLSRPGTMCKPGGLVPGCTCRVPWYTRRDFPPNTSTSPLSSKIWCSLQSHDSLSKKYALVGGHRSKRLSTTFPSATNKLSTFVQQKKGIGLVEQDLHSSALPSQCHQLIDLEGYRRYAWSLWVLAKHKYARKTQKTGGETRNFSSIPYIQRRGRFRFSPVMRSIAILAGSCSFFIYRNRHPWFPATERWQSAIKECHAVSHTYTDLLSRPSVIYDCMHAEDDIIHTNHNFSNRSKAFFLC